MFFTTPLKVPEGELPISTTYFGYIGSLSEALYVLEATRIGILNPIHQRLTNDQRKAIKSGSCFIWEKNLSGIQRWTDGRAWSASRYDDHFLVYKEVSPKSPKYTKTKLNSSEASNSSNSLYKRSISISTTDGKNYHILNYYTQEDVLLKSLNIPSQDPKLKDLKIPQNYYYKDYNVDNTIEYINIDLPSSDNETHSRNKNSIANLLNHEDDTPKRTLSDPVLEYNNAAFLTKERRALTDATDKVTAVCSSTGTQNNHRIISEHNSELNSALFTSKSNNLNSEDKRQLELLRLNLNL